MRLLIVSHTPHYVRDGAIVGWGPTVREIDYLARMFDEVIHVAFLHQVPPPESALAYRSPNVRVLGVTPSGGPRIKDKIGILFRSFEYLRTIRRHLGRSYMVHVRCPASISLMALALLSLKREPSHRWVKYAGNWWPEGREPWSYRFQRWWLNRNIHRGVVTVNGRWPDQPRHIFSFLNPCLTSEEIRTVYRVARNKKLTEPLRLIFVGHLSKSKGVLQTLAIVEKLIAQKFNITLDIVGDGPMAEILKRKIEEKKLENAVVLHGWRQRTELGQYYSRAHFLLFPSKSEGWPKVISEAMAYGVVPLAGAVSSIPQILGEIGTGRFIHPDNIDEYVQTILFYLDHPEVWEKERDAGLKAAPLFTYEAYLDAVRSMFKQAWNLDLTEDSKAVIQRTASSA